MNVRLADWRKSITRPAAGRWVSPTLRACGVMMGLMAGAARAGEVLDRVQRDGIVHCGATARPGFADADGGMAADLCRAVAVAVAGPSARVAFHLYAAGTDFDPVRQGRDELVFLSGEVVATESLFPAITPGPAVFVEQLSLLVPAASHAERPADLAGQVVCFMTASPAHQALEAALGPAQPPVARLAFQEEVEMLDAFNAGRCAAMAGEATWLSTVGRGNAINRRPSRVLAEPLGAYPVFAATPRSDGAWTADVAWVMGAVLNAALRASPWRGEWSVAAPGLRPGWHREVIDLVGDYRALYGRHLDLPPGPNQPWPDGALLTLGP